jgi:transcriptional regulator with XRE-family HTH domain
MLSDEKVEQVHKLRSETNPSTRKRWTYFEIAVKLGVSPSTVYNIIKGKTHGRK